jgi:hypothetical protein
LEPSLYYRRFTNLTFLTETFQNLYYFMSCLTIFSGRGPSFGGRKIVGKCRSEETLKGIKRRSTRSQSHKTFLSLTLRPNLAESQLVEHHLADTVMLVEMQLSNEEMRAKIGEGM